MWEEPGNCVRVVHRRFSENPDEDEEGRGYACGGELEDWLLVDEQEPLPQEPAHSPSTEHSDGNIVVKRPRIYSRARSRPESVCIEPPHSRQLLSSFGAPLPTQSHHSSSTESYALLTAEKPFFQKKAKTIAGKFIQVAGTDDSLVQAIRWKDRELAVLYKFSSQAEYEVLAAKLKAGKLWNVRDYRVVGLQPVRLIDANLRATVEISFDAVLAPRAKKLLSPLLSPIIITAGFFYFTATLPEQPLAETHSTGLPSVVVTLITHLPQTAAANAISEVLSSPDWETTSVSDLNNPFKTPTLYHHKEMRPNLPLFSLASGRVGLSTEDSLQITFICNSPDAYTAAVEFYKIVFQEAEVMSAQKDYTHFSLTLSPTSHLQLCIYQSPLLDTIPIPAFSFHCYVSSLVSVVIKLVRQCGSNLVEGAMDNSWLATDPLGNQVVLHDLSAM